ncbi:MAG: hypothetical protein WD424_04650 [Paenibacillaceae bacterium]
MFKKCNCGQPMDIRLRTVIYSKTVEIDNVPIYTCAKCFHTEILTGVKSDLAQLISQLGGQPHIQKINFHELNEWAFLISKATDLELVHKPIQSIVGERIDQLLDLLLLARSLHDVRWENDLVGRLTQITKSVLIT